MKYRIEIIDLGVERYGDDGTIFISDPIEATELFTEILPVLLKPSMFNSDVYRISIIPEE